MVWNRAGHVTLASALNPEFWVLLKIRGVRGGWMGGGVGVKAQCVFQHFQTNRRATVYHFLSEDLFANRCSSSG